MTCNDGLHGALYKNFREEWFCLLCGERITDLNSLEERRRVAKLISKPESKEEDDNS